MRTITKLTGCGLVPLGGQCTSTSGKLDFRAVQQHIACETTPNISNQRGDLKRCWLSNSIALRAPGKSIASPSRGFEVIQIHPQFNRTPANCTPPLGNQLHRLLNCTPQFNSPQGNSIPLSYRIKNEIILPRPQ